MLKFLLVTSFYLQILSGAHIILVYKIVFVLPAVHESSLSLKLMHGILRSFLLLNAELELFSMQKFIFDLSWIYISQYIHDSVPNVPHLPTVNNGI